MSDAPCGGYACVNRACLTACSTSDDCASKHICDVDKCVDKALPEGSPCVLDDDCASLNCRPRPGIPNSYACRFDCSVSDPCPSKQCLGADGDTCDGTSPCFCF